jgi:hypothetical protein
MPLTAVLKDPSARREAGLPADVGGGLGVYFGDYTETGEFLATDGTIFRDTFAQAATSVGPVAVFGLQGPRRRVQPRRTGRALPVGTADLSETSTKLDLGGFKHPRHVRLSILGSAWLTRLPVPQRRR